MVHEYEDGGVAVFHGTRRLGRYDAKGRLLDRPERRHEPFRRPPRLAPLASSDGGTPKRTIHVLRKPDILFAPDTRATKPCGRVVGKV